MFVSEIYDEVSEILGISDETRIFKKLTRAIAALMESGHWFHGNNEVDVCTGWDGVTLTLPRGIEVPLAVNVDGSPTYFRNRLFQYHVNKGGVYNTVPWAWDDRGVVATIMDIRQPSEVLAVAENPNDAGKTIRLLGKDGNGRDIISQLDDGTTVDGLLLNIHALSDFEYGVITPDGNRINTRSAAITPFTNFISSSVHYLTSGQPVVISPISGTLPSPLIAGNTYYVGAVSPTTIELYSDPLYAQQGLTPIPLQSIAGAGPISAITSITSQVVTAVNIFPSTIPITINTQNGVVFTEASNNSLPSPLIPGATYFANQLDQSNLQVFNSITDATNGTNPVYLSGSTSAFNLNLRIPIAPQSQFQITNGLYSTGDTVQVYNTAGTIPSPLVAAQNYYVHVLSSGNITLHSNETDAISGNNPITVTSTGTGSSGIVKTLSATANQGLSNQLVVPGLNVQSPTGSGAVITPIITGSVVSANVTNPGTGYLVTPNVTFSQPTYVPPQGTNTNQTTRAAAGYAVMAPQGSSTTKLQVASIVITDGGAGYTANPIVTIDPPVGPNETTATANALVTLSLLSNYSVSYGGQGYVNPPILTITGGGGSGATAQCAQPTPIDPVTGLGGALTSVIAQTLGTGYTSAPTIKIQPSTGASIQVSSSGALPAPLQPGVEYNIGLPLDPKSSTYTILNADNTPIDITSIGSGAFDVEVTYTLTPKPLNTWTGDFTGLSSYASPIYFGTDYQLPLCIPGIDNGVNPYAFNYLTSSTASFSKPDGTPIEVIGFGIGQSYLVLRLSATALPYQNLINPLSVQYLQNGQPVQFSTSSSGGSLPGGINAGQNYNVVLNGENISLTQNGIPTILSSVGTGALSLNVVNTFTAQPSTTITCDNSALATGTGVIPRPSAGDALDPSLVAGTAYYVNRVDPNTFSLYQTYAEAFAGGPTGLLSYVTTGNTSQSTFFLDAVLPPTLVKTVDHIDKAVTQGYVSLYAFDYGRSNDMALIGQYHPTETNPRYRRVRIGQKCAWARIMYRAKAPTITSIYDYIPLEQSRALICAVHAVDLEDKDFIDQAAIYWKRADDYLRNLQTSMDGHAMQAIQVNNICYGPGEGCIMT